MMEEYSYGIIPLKKEGNCVKVLVILHKKGRHWGLPKGRKNQGESDRFAAERELQEETGLTTSSYLQETPYQETYQFYRPQGKITKTVFYYPAFVEGTLELQKEEVVDARWVLLSEAHRCLTFKGAREICAKVQEDLAKQW